MNSGKLSLLGFSSHDRISFTINFSFGYFHNGWLGLILFLRKCVEMIWVNSPLTISVMQSHEICVKIIVTDNIGLDHNEHALSPLSNPFPCSPQQTLCYSLNVSLLQGLFECGMETWYCDSCEIGNETWPLLAVEEPLRRNCDSEVHDSDLHLVLLRENYLDGF